MPWIVNVQGKNPGGACAPLDRLTIGPCRLKAGGWQAKAPNATYFSHNPTPALIVGQSPWTAADAPVGLLALCRMLISLLRPRDEGVPRRPGGLPHKLCSIPVIGKTMWHWPGKPPRAKDNSPRRKPCGTGR